MPATLAERFVFGTADPKPVTSVHIVPRATTATLGRFALAAVFMIAGIAKLADSAGTIAHMDAAGIPFAGPVLYVSAFVEIVGALSLALGAFARIGAVALAVYLVVVSLVFHAFWNYEDVARGKQLVNFLKNLAIVGGLLMIVAHGPGRASVDARLRSSLVTFVIALLALVGCRLDRPTTTTQPIADTPVGAPQTDPERVARGSYVVALAGCKVCHESGPNLTPSRIGAWSETQIISALRRGVRPDGGKLSPSMPYTYFHRMTDADARAVVAYLRTMRPVSRVVEPGAPSPLQPIDLPEPVDNVDPIDDAKGHGEYLANLMHCGACHTPRSGPHAYQAFAGGVELLAGPNAVTSPNLTSDPDTGLGRWTELEIITAVRTGKTPNGHDIVGPMRAYMEGWSRIDERDARDLASYIKSLPAISNEVPERHASAP